MRFDAYPYDRVASFYDELGELYSRGRIARSKRHFVAQIPAGDRALFVGVGRGDEAIEAAAAGVRVTAIDLSAQMLARFTAGLAARGLEAETIHADVAAHPPRESFDVVVVHYFLNLFDLETAHAMLERLAPLVRPGGRLLLADFAPARPGRLSRWATAAYYRLANGVAWALGFCALHPIPDHEQMLIDVGLEIEDLERFPVFWTGGPAYVAIRVRRPFVSRNLPAGR